MKFRLLGVAVTVGLLYTTVEALLRTRSVSIGWNRFAAAWLIASYIFLIWFDVSKKKRTISIIVQTLLGAFVAAAAVWLFGAPLEHAAIAATIGAGLGWTADLRIRRVRLP